MFPLIFFPCSCIFISPCVVSIPTVPLTNYRVTGGITLLQWFPSRCSWIRSQFLFLTVGYITQYLYWYRAISPFFPWHFSYSPLCISVIIPSRLQSPVFSSYFTTRWRCYRHYLFFRCLFWCFQIETEIITFNVIIYIHFISFHKTSNFFNLYLCTRSNYCKLLRGLQYSPHKINRRSLSLTFLYYARSISFITSVFWCGFVWCLTSSVKNCVLPFLST